MTPESRFQAKVIRKINELFPGCVILKNDSRYIQGIPDLLVLYNNRWAALECKESKEATIGLNQPYYVDKLRKMSYASFVYPENLLEVLNELQQTLRL